jgi:hypothetical protein
MWSHQYDQQPNQIACTRAHRQWSTNGPDSNLFGLEPNFGCCTANLHQGWPKLVSSLWMATADRGLITAAYAPSQVHTKMNGVQVMIDEDTEYPFRGTVRFVVHTARPVLFPFVLRIPGWAGGATVGVNGIPAQIQKSGLYSIKRSWKEGDRVTVKFPMSSRVSHWFHDSAVFERGPLVFSLPLDGQWSALKKYAEKSADWQITSTADWNYAVQLGDCNAKVLEEPVGPVPFDIKNPSVSLSIKARRDRQWSTVENSAGPVPSSPVTSPDPLQTLTLIPYGAAKLRITAFPYLREKSQCGSASAGLQPVFGSLQIR